METLKVVASLTSKTLFFLEHNGKKSQCFWFHNELGKVYKLKHKMYYPISIPLKINGPFLLTHIYQMRDNIYWSESSEVLRGLIRCSTYSFKIIRIGFKVLNSSTPESKKKSVITYFWEYNRCQWYLKIKKDKLI